MKFFSPYLLLATLGLFSCSERDGHAKPDEDAELIQLGPPTVKDQMEEIQPISPESIVPKATEAAAPILVKPNIIPQATPHQNPQAPIAETVDPFPSLAAGQITASQISENDYTNPVKRFADVQHRATEKIRQVLLEKELFLGDPVFIRVIKDEKLVELFIHSRKTKTYHLAQTYNIAAMSGYLGPKTAEGDQQAPEGFYYVPLRSLNPASSYHLSFNIGYPNSYDTAHGYTGSFIMMHGNKVSIGCYAMTDPVIEEIYTICHAALNSGKQRFFRFHSFPFRMSDKNMVANANSDHQQFWKNLQEGYQHFETHHSPPAVDVVNKVYQFSIDSPISP